MNKKIIDVCCGSRMFWFDRQNPNVEFCDNRRYQNTNIIRIDIRRKIKCQEKECL